MEELRTATNRACVLGNDWFQKRIERQLKRQVSPKPRGGDRRSKAEIQENHSRLIPLVSINQGDGESFQRIISWQAGEVSGILSAATMALSPTALPVSKQNKQRAFEAVGRRFGLTVRRAVHTRTNYRGISPCW